MRLEATVACAVFLAISSASAWAAQKADFSKLSKEAVAEFDSFTEEPSPGLLEERRRAAMSRVHPDDHGALHSNAPAHPKARLKYYTDVSRSR